MLASPPPRWVLDASVVINLLSTPYPERIIAALGAPCAMPEIAAREVKRLEHPSRRGRVPFEEVRGIVEVFDLEDAEWELFGELVSAPSPDDLDDGEAAVLALAAKRGGACLIDERKCTRVAGTLKPPVPCRTTVDVLRWCTRQSFSDDEIARCVEDALQFGRMRVVPEHDAWVRQIIGVERAMQFPSLRQRSNRIVVGAESRSR